MAAISRLLLQRCCRRIFKIRGMEEDTESVLGPIRSLLRQIETMLDENHDAWETYLPEALSATASLDRIHYFSKTDRLPEQRLIIKVLQEYAYHDSDSGAIKEIADWCRSSWLRVLRDHPEDADILAGLGQNWLQRSQVALARIHRQEGSGSSTGSSTRETRAAAAQRLQSPLFVEARGHLLPASDFYKRAVFAAEREGTLTGPLLASAAESFMSLGNVSAHRSGEQHFEQAIRYLRRARAIPGYALSIYLQQYLEDYGRFVT